MQHPLSFFSQAPRLRLNRQFYFWQKSKTAGCRQKLCFSGKRKGVLLRSNWWNIQSSSAPDNQSKAKARNIILSAAGGSLFSSRRQRGESFLKMTAQLSGDNFQAKCCCYLCCKFFLDLSVNDGKIANAGYFNYTSHNWGQAFEQWGLLKHEVNAGRRTNNNN